MKKNKLKEDKKHFPILLDCSKTTNHKIIYIQGIEIHFPYEPYEPQKLYMEKIISTLNNEGNITALESPTGTGKTLCLLCAILAWIKHKNESISIYYCTRTVSQINNILKELNKTCYCPNVSFLTSRKFTCLKYSKKEKEKMDNNKLNDICEFFRKKKSEKESKLEIEYSNLTKKLITNRKLLKKSEEKKIIKKLEDLENSINSINLNICKFYKSEDNYEVNNYNNLEDIEDLLKEGNKNEFCPYFYNIHKTKMSANITIMTYN